MAFPAVAAVLIGGATATKASCVNVVVGVCIFQGLMTAAMPVANALFTGTDLSDIMRQVIQAVMINEQASNHQNGLMIAVIRRDFRHGSQIAGFINIAYFDQNDL